MPPRQQHAHAGSRLPDVTGIPQFLFQIAWMTIVVFMLSQAGEWFVKSTQGVVSPIWPASGFAVAVALLYGLDRALPAAYLGTLVSYFVSDEPALYLYAGPIANVLGVFVGYSLLTRFVSCDLASLRDFVRFVLAGCIPGPLVAAATNMLAAYFSGKLPNAQFERAFLDCWAANAFGVLIFCPFFLFAFRRQDFRPPTTAGRYELLGSSLILAGIISVLLNVRGMDRTIVLLLLGAILALALMVSIRFGLRTAVLFQAILIFLVPACVVMFPERAKEMRMFQHVSGSQEYLNGLAFLSSLGCLLLATLRDELASLRIKFALAMDSADLCVWDWSPIGWRCHTATWREKFGLPNTQWTSDDRFRNLVHPDDRPDFEESFRKLESLANTHWSQTCRMQDVQGHWRWVQLEAKPLSYTADDVLAVVAGVMRDVTEEKEAIQTRIAAIETEAELSRLRSQLNPHFLFNALNSVRALIGRQDALARTMISSLGTLLRELLSIRDNKLQSLEKEAGIVRNYLEIEAIRFGSRLRYTINYAPELATRHLPGMLVLTLVENAVKHGICKLESGGALEVSFKLSNDNKTLVVVVVNDGPLGPPSSGIGIANTRMRIALATSGRGSLEIREIPGPRVEAVATLPLDDHLSAHQLPVDKI